ncbi:MAG: hypothetical protein JNL72_09065 [Flavipsychrobacter sp.]|nr:hypothetical protein [Flavipsychrobacter sp.]
MAGNAQLKVFKVNALPGTLVANAIYYVRSGGMFRTVITGNAGEIVQQDSVTAAQLAGKQNASAELTAIAGISAANDDIIQRKAGAWVNRTPAQVKADLALAKGDVGLGNVDNTSDVNKPVSTATQTAINSTNSTLSAHTGNTNNPHNTTLEKARAAGNTLSGAINMGGNRIQNLPDAAAANEPLTKGQFDALNTTAGRQRGELNCSTNPNYPAAKAGDRWEVIAAGKIGGAAGIDVDVYDEIVCKADSPGGAQAAAGNSFYVVQGNLMRATETVTGYSRIATTEESNEGSDNTTIMTPLKVRQRIDAVAVKTTGAQTIDGVKRFNISPVIPDAVNNNEAASRGQVAAMIGGSGAHTHGNINTLNSISSVEGGEDTLAFGGSPVMRWEIVEW